MIGPKQVKEDVTAQVVRGCWMLPPSIANQPPSVQLSTRQPTIFKYYMCMALQEIGQSVNDSNFKTPVDGYSSRCSESHKGISHWTTTHDFDFCCNFKECRVSADGTRHINI